MSSVIGVRFTDYYVLSLQNIYVVPTVIRWVLALLNIAMKMYRRGCNSLRRHIQVHSVSTRTYVDAKFVHRREFYSWRV